MFKNFKKKLSSIISNSNSNFENEEPKEEKAKKNIFKKIVSKITKKKIDENDFEKIWENIEIYLFEINISYKIVMLLKDKLKLEIIGKEFSRTNLEKKFLELLNKETTNFLKKRESNFLEQFKIIKKADENGLVKILVLGVNGVGKTTTIAKIINYLKNNNLTCCVSASDTFRAAAIEQLEFHCDKLNVKIIKHQKNSDPASVAFDGVEYAKSKKLDCVIIDTAGRQPNNSNLIKELEKIKRVSKSQMTIFVGDSNSGNDMLNQIESFNKILKINGVILTKIDTDNKPGSIINVAYDLDSPIYFLGIGQEYKDLEIFNSKKITQILFS
jgi:fused signal recognition particle receptor